MLLQRLRYGYDGFMKTAWVVVPASNRRTVVPMSSSIDVEKSEARCTSPSMAGVTAATTRAIFSYGSNSTAQLRARVRNRELETYKARVLGWSRVFHLYSGNWQGATASLSSDPESETRGTIAYLSEDETAVLSEFETGHSLVAVTARVEKDGIESDIAAHVYIAPSPPKGLCTPFPSEQYLCAVSGMLREHWPSHADELVVSVEQDGRIIERGRWVHPGARHVASVRAIAIEIGLRLKKPWVMPRDCAAFEHTTRAALEATTTGQFWEAVRVGGADAVAKDMLFAASSQFAFDADDVTQALRRMMAEE